MRIEEWEKKLTSEQSKVYKQERNNPDSEVNSIHWPKKKGRFPYTHIEKALNKLLAPEHQFEVDEKALKKAESNTKYNAKKKASQTTTGSSMGKEISKASNACKAKMYATLHAKTTPNCMYAHGMYAGWWCQGGHGPNEHV